MVTKNTSAPTSSVEALLRDRGISFETTVVNLSDLVVDETVQVRTGANRAPKRNVDQYRIAMANGSDHFPPLLTTHDWRLIDGNTRAEAARKAGLLQFAVIRITDPTIPADTLRLLSIETNQTNGERMDNKDLESVVDAYIRAHVDEAIDVAKLSGRTGVAASRINAMLRAARFDRDARAAGIDDAVIAGLSESQKKHLGRLGSVPLLRQATDLAAKANMSVREVSDLVGSTLEAAKTGEADAVAVLDATADDLRPRMQSGGIAGPRRSPMTSHKMHLSYIVLRIAPDDILSVADKDRDAYVAQAREAIAKLQALVATAEAHPVTPAAPAVEDHTGGLVRPSTAA